MRLVFVPACAAIVLAVPAPAAAIDDGPASVQLPQCATGTPIAQTRVPDCSYIALPGKDGAVYYGYLSSAGPVNWGGSVTGTILDFPATGQQWPTLAPLFSGIGSARVIPGHISGRLSDSGYVEFTLTFNARVEALGSQCTATGTVTVSSEATDMIGGGVGAPLAGGRFAAAGTSTSAPMLTGSACSQAASYLDLSRGVGVFAAGLLTLGGTSSGASAGAQTASFNTPKRIRRQGATVVLTRRITTNAGQRAIATLTWSTKKRANGSSRRLASAQTTKSGRLILTTTGAAKRLHVRLTVSAPPQAGYNEMLITKTWVVR